MAAKARGARKQMKHRRAAGGIRMFGGRPRHQKPGLPLPPGATTLTPQGQKVIRHGKIENHYLGGDTRNVSVSPFRTGMPLF